MFQLVIVLSLVVGYYWNSILYLEVVGIGSVIHQHYLTQTPIAQHSQILNIHSLLSMPTVVSVQTVGYHLRFGVQIVDHHVSVTGVAGSEDDDFEPL